MVDSCFRDKSIVADLTDTAMERNVPVVVVRGGDGGFGLP